MWEEDASSSSFTTTLIEKKEDREGCRDSPSSTAVIEEEEERPPSMATASSSTPLLESGKEATWGTGQREGVMQRGDRIKRPSGGLADKGLSERAPPWHMPDERFGDTSRRDV